MKVPPLLVLAVGGWCLPWTAPAAQSTADDRIALSGQASTLTGTHGGGGGSLAWLHNFDAESVLGLGVEHQVLGTAHWTFGSISGSISHNSGASRYSVYAEAHEGAGRDRPGSFSYSNVAAGVIATWFHRLSLQLEDRQFDILTTHGNLPKVQLSYLLNPHYLATASFADSVSGNLGTHLFAARLDRYGSRVNWLAGASYGRATPAVLNLQTAILIPGRTLREGYAGITWLLPQWRGELSVIADYQDLSGSKRATLTLNYVFHVGHAVTVR